METIVLQRGDTNLKISLALEDKNVQNGLPQLSSVSADHVHLVGKWRSFPCKSVRLKMNMICKLATYLWKENHVNVTYLFVCIICFHTVFIVCSNINAKTCPSTTVGAFCTTQWCDVLFVRIEWLCKMIRPKHWLMNLTAKNQQRSQKVQLMEIKRNFFIGISKSQAVVFALWMAYTAVTFNSEVSCDFLAPGTYHRKQTLSLLNPNSKGYNKAVLYSCDCFTSLATHISLLFIVTIAWYISSFKYKLKWRLLNLQTASLPVEFLSPGYHLLPLQGGCALSWPNIFWNIIYRCLVEQLGLPKIY